MRLRHLALPLAALAMLTFSGCATNAAPASEPAASTSAPATNGDRTCTYTATGAAAKEVTPPPTTPEVSGTVNLTMQTSIGDLKLALDADATPCTTGSFASLAKQGYFDATSCHRLTTAGIMVLQCGDPSGTGTGNPGYRFADELTTANALEDFTQAAGYKVYPAGTIAMANAGPGTNGSQFFLVYADSPLQPNYTVFGKLDDASTKLVQELAAAGTATGEADGAPKTPVTITAVTLD